MHYPKGLKTIYNKFACKNFWVIIIIRKVVDFTVVHGDHYIE